ncbi:1294_t:CDS:2, partial [Racocetra persica]
YEDNNNLSTEWFIDLTQDQTNISLPSYNNLSIEWSRGFNQDQINNNLPIELSTNFTQNQINKSLLNFYNNLSIEWFTEFSQNRTNNNVPTKISVDFITNNTLMKWNRDFTPNQTNTSSLNINNNLIIELLVSIAQNDENQTNHNLSVEWTTCFTQDQTNNTNLLNRNNTEITQHYESQINTIQQDDAKLVKENKSPISLVSRRKKNPRCKKCNLKKPHYDENSNQCKDCYRASLRVLSSNKLIDDFIKSIQTSYNILNGLRPKIPIDISQKLVKIMENCWHPDLDKRIKLDCFWALQQLITKAIRREIKFLKNKDTSILLTKMNKQAIYSSQPLIPLISKALTLQ